MIDIQDVYACLLIKVLCVAVHGGMYWVSILFLKPVAG